MSAFRPVIKLLSVLLLAANLVLLGGVVRAADAVAQADAFIRKAATEIENIDEANRKLDTELGALRVFVKKAQLATADVTGDRNAMTKALEEAVKVGQELKEEQAKEAPDQAVVDAKKKELEEKKKLYGESKTKLEVSEAILKQCLADLAKSYETAKKKHGDLISVLKPIVDASSDGGGSESAALSPSEAAPVPAESVLRPRPDPIASIGQEIPQQFGDDVIQQGHKGQYIQGAEFGTPEYAGEPLFGPGIVEPHLFESGGDFGMPGQLGELAMFGNATAPPPPDNQFVTLVPPGLSGMGGAMLHVDVPDGARVTIDNHITRSRNWSRYRHYRITGLEPDSLRPVCVTVTFIRDVRGCVQKQYTCTKSVQLKAGDNESLSFRLGDFEKPRILKTCKPT